MKTQLALMKNTIAFSLYIDETLQIDLTDPQTTSLMQAITPSIPRVFQSLPCCEVVGLTNESVVALICSSNALMELSCFVPA